MYSWVTASRSKPQGEAEFTLNGKRVYPVTSALVFPHVVIYVSLHLSASFCLCAADCLTVCFSLLLILAAVRAQTTATE